MPDDVSEKSTKQLAVWWRLAGLLDELGVAWRETLATTTTRERDQLPANLTVALMRAGAAGAEVTAGLSKILAEQADSGHSLTTVADLARQVDAAWPKRRAVG